MIDLTKLTPEEYSRQSRDYQILARLYSAIFNVSKMYIDDMAIWDYDIDNKLSLLRAKTLNFEPTHAWDFDDLDAVTSCFKYLIRNKGTKRALEYLISVLMKVRRVNQEFDDSTITIENGTITIRIESDIISLGILEDLIKYILPAGFLYRIIYYKSYNLKDIVQTELKVVNGGATVGKKQLSYSMYVGDSNSKKRFMNKTYIYGSKEMDGVPDSNSSDTEEQDEH